MPLNLTANECRVIGSLMEKSINTPDQYPLTLNALTKACNQKSGRDPVMSLTQGEVQHTARVVAPHLSKAAHVPQSTLGRVYSNQMVVSHTREEFLIDFVNLAREDLRTAVTLKQRREARAATAV